jgi:hypothetical protein
MTKRLALKPHLDTPCQAATRIEVDVVRPAPGSLILRYVLTGAVDDLLLPPATAPERSDRLWQHTCFEIFIRATSEESYHEFNFAPSGQWAAYRFEARRSGMTNMDIAPPSIGTGRTGEGFELRATLNVAGLPADKLWLVGLSAVIEEKNGCKSYWALAHPPGEPDFHHPACFALQLPPAA